MIYFGGRQIIDSDGTSIHFYLDPRLAEAVTIYVDQANVQPRPAEEATIFSSSSIPCANASLVTSDKYVVPAKVYGR